MGATATVKIMSEKQLEVIGQHILEELMKRGIHVEIEEIVEKVNRNGRHRIEFETTSFQTTPVLMKELRITNFSSSIGDVVIDSYRECFIAVHVSYIHFGGGGNGTSLFDVRFKVYKDDDEEIYDFNVF